MIGYSRQVIQPFYLHPAFTYENFLELEARTVNCLIRKESGITVSSCFHIETLIEMPPGLPPEKSSVSYRSLVAWAIAQAKVRKEFSFPTEVLLLGETYTLEGVRNLSVLYPEYRWLAPISLINTRHEDVWGTPPLGAVWDGKDSLPIQASRLLAEHLLRHL